ncbi:MAG TPA: BtpA family membrane complex biogenesis protein [Clostridiales bacterium]|nr:BtpA family membrane complex biogenesis protein [Clostridiales bacterium]
MFQEAHDYNHKLIFGLIHLRPMPGTPFYKDGDYEASIEKAIKDAKALENGGASGCLIQTVDKVYPNGDDSDYVRATCMSVIATEVRKVVGSDFKIGVQLMWNCITPSLAVAKAVNADFTRCTALIGQTVSPFGGMTQSNPLEVLEYRRKIEAENVEMIAEIAGYHFQSGYEKEALLKRVHEASMVKAGAVEIMSKDETLNNQMAEDIRKAFPHMPIILGGGTDVESVKRRLQFADGALVGSCFEGNKWGEGIQESIVADYMREVHSM